MCVIMLTVDLLPILTDWGLPVKMSRSQCVDSLWVSLGDDCIKGDAAVHKNHLNVGIFIVQHFMMIGVSATGP